MATLYFFFQGIISNQTLAYYIARIQQFLVKIGVNPSKLRFRQHVADEVAHYAAGCWDAECLTSYGWLECVGCADRSGYDLTAHSRATAAKLTAERQLPAPKTLEVLVPVINRQNLEKRYGKRSKDVEKVLAELNYQQLFKLNSKIAEQQQCPIPETEFSVDRQILSFVKEFKEVKSEEIVPSVIEPSFGIGRLFYVLLEHSFSVRGDQKRSFFAIRQGVAPIKALVVPLSLRHAQQCAPFIQQIGNYYYFFGNYFFFNYFFLL